MLLLCLCYPQTTARLLAGVLHLVYVPQRPPDFFLRPMPRVLCPVSCISCSVSRTSPCPVFSCPVFSVSCPVCPPLQSLDGLPGSRVSCPAFRVPCPVSHAPLIRVCPPRLYREQVFGVTFRTPPEDSTGVPHILEHSVLCGSRNYPVKEPFVDLLKGSLQTFLNAFTYPDRTCYPVASQNLKVGWIYYSCFGLGRVSRGKGFWRKRGGRGGEGIRFGMDGVYPCGLIFLVYSIWFSCAFYSIFFSPVYRYLSVCCVGPKHLSQQGSPVCCIGRRSWRRQFCVLPRSAKLPKEKGVSPRLIHVWDLPLLRGSLTSAFSYSRTLSRPLSPSAGLLQPDERVP